MDDEIKGAWSPNGLQIVFARETAGNFELFLIFTDGTGETQLTDGDIGEDRDPSYAVVSATPGWPSKAVRMRAARASS